MSKQKNYIILDHPCDNCGNKLFAVKVAPTMAIHSGMEEELSMYQVHCQNVKCSFSDNSSYPTEKSVLDKYKVIKE